MKQRYVLNIRCGAVMQVYAESLPEALRKLADEMDKIDSKEYEQNSMHIWVFN